MNIKLVWLSGALIFALFGTWTGYYAVTIPWPDRIDFDVIGVLFLMQSAPKLFAWFLTATFGVVALYLVGRAIRA